MATPKVKVVKAKVVKVPRKVRTAAKFEEFQVFHIDEDGCRDYFDTFETAAEAREHIKNTPRLAVPIIVHVELPAMKY